MHDCKSLRYCVQSVYKYRHCGLETLLCRPPKLNNYPVDFFIKFAQFFPQQVKEKFESSADVSLNAVSCLLYECTRSTSQARARVTFDSCSSHVGLFTKKLS